MEIQRALNSCGIRQVEGVGGLAPDVIMGRVANIVRKEGHDGAWLTFSDRSARKTIKPLQKFIEEKRLGKTTLFDSRTNPNSGHKIQMLIWEFDRGLFLGWARGFYPTRVGKKYKIIGNSCNHDRSIGDVIEYCDDRDDNSFYYKDSWYILLSDVEEIK